MPPSRYSQVLACCGDLGWRATAGLVVPSAAGTVVRRRRLGDRLAALVGEEDREVEPIADDSCIFDRHDGGRKGDGVLEHVTDRRPDGLLEAGRPLGIRRTRESK